MVRGEKAGRVAELDAASPLGSLLLLSCALIWGVNAVAYKVGGRTFDPVLMNGLRFLAVAPCLALLVAVWQPAALRVAGRGDLVRYALFGLISIALGETLLMYSVRYTSVANMTLLGPGTVSLFTALWAVALKEQTLTRYGWVGALVALLGVGIVASQGTHGGGQSLRLDARSLFGDGIALLRSAVQGGYMLLLARTLRERPVLTVTVYNVVFGALWLLPCVAWRVPGVAWVHVPGAAWGALLWTILPTTVYGFLAWNWGMRQVGAVAATNLFYLIPFFAALAAWVLLREPLTVGQVLGGLVIVAGIVLVRWDTLLSAGVSLDLPRVRVPWQRP
jgi:drug/metabolite transporter (DMT)-like permease